MLPSSVRPLYQHHNHRSEFELEFEVNGQVEDLVAINKAFASSALALSMFPHGARASRERKQCFDRISPAYKTWGMQTCSTIAFPGANNTLSPLFDIASHWFMHRLRRSLSPLSAS